jgi:hypothetical protein
MEKMPMFGGLYQIMSVRHSITPNDMTTNAKAIRMRYDVLNKKYGGMPPITLEDLMALGGVEAPMTVDVKTSQGQLDSGSATDFSAANDANSSSSSAASTGSVNVDNYWDSITKVSYIQCPALDKNSSMWKQMNEKYLPKQEGGVVPSDSLPPATCPVKLGAKHIYANRGFIWKTFYDISVLGDTSAIGIPKKSSYAGSESYESFVGGRFIKLTDSESIKIRDANFKRDYLPQYPGNEPIACCMYLTLHSIGSISRIDVQLNKITGGNSAQLIAKLRAGNVTERYVFERINIAHAMAIKQWGFAHWDVAQSNVKLFNSLFIDFTKG